MFNTTTLSLNIPAADVNINKTKKIEVNQGVDSCRK